MVPGKLALREALSHDVAELRAVFRAQAGFLEPQARRLRNPHLEGPVPEQVVAQAVPSAIMVLVTDEASPRVVLTKRQQGIRFAGQLCFPGGRSDPGETSLETALREAQEEIGLAKSAVEVLGSYGHYYTQAGFRIAPYVGIVAPDYEYQPDPSEVASLHYVPLADVLNPAAYRLKSFNAERAYFAFEQQGIHVGGPTVSLMIGLLEWLWETREVAS